MANQDFRASPNDWKIKGNGAVIEAISTSTNDVFTGTIDAFNAYIKTFSPFAGNDGGVPSGYTPVYTKANDNELGDNFYAKGTAIPGGVTQVPSDWNAAAGVSRILNKPTILDIAAVRAAVAAMFAGTHTNASVAYNAGTGILTITASGGGGGTTAEEVQDFLNTALAHGNHSGVTVTYDDANNRFVITAAGGSGDTTLSRKIALTVNSQPVSVVVTGVGTSAAINAVTATHTLDGQSGSVITLANMGTFKLRNVSVYLSPNANSAGSQFTLIAPDPSGATALSDSSLADMVIYNEAGAIQASTQVTVSLTSGNLSVMKTGFSLSLGARFRVTF